MGSAITWNYKTQKCQENKNQTPLFGNEMCWALCKRNEWKYPGIETFSKEKVKETSLNVQQKIGLLQWMDRVSQAEFITASRIGHRKLFCPSGFYIIYMDQYSGTKLQHFLSLVLRSPQSGEPGCWFSLKYVSF